MPRSVLEGNRFRKRRHEGDTRERTRWGLTSRAGESSGQLAPSPENVEADVALEVNVGVIDHRLTLHLGGVMRVTLAHLERKREDR